MPEQTPQLQSVHSPALSTAITASLEVLVSDYPGFVGVEDYLTLSHNPSTWLIKDLIPLGGSALLFGQPKTGKALCLDTPILTPTGWCTMRDISTGDLVYGSDGKPCQVLAVSPIMTGRPCFKITFGDGNSIVTDANHEWTIFENCGANRMKRTLTTKEILDRGLFHANPDKRGYQKTRWKVQLPGAIVYPALSSLEFDPYCLGTWLGDGTSRKAEITSADPEIVQAWTDAGFKMVFVERYCYRIRKDGRPAQFIHKLNIRDNKHIPHQYLYGSYETRLALLQGLMDTDGSCEYSNSRRSGTPTFWNTNKKLTEQVYELAVGLGARVKWHQKKASVNGKDCGLVYYLSIRSTFPTFRLERKAKGVTIDKQGYWSLKSIEPVESVPVKCIMVDTPDHLYLAGKNCLPTHNSALAIQLAVALSNGDTDWMGFQVITPGRILYLQLDTPRSTWRLRFEALKRFGLHLDNDNLMLADRDSLEYHPFDILQPSHMKYLSNLVKPLNPVAVFVDTLRKVHTGDEDKSTNMSNVVSSLIAAVRPAALVLISHSRKPHPESTNDLMSSHRGSGSVVGEMDAIMQMTHTTVTYGGRNIEEGEFKIDKMDSDGVLLWKPREDPAEMNHVINVMKDTSLTSLRARGRALGKLIGKPEDAAVSILRRAEKNPRYRIKV